MTQTTGTDHPFAHLGPAPYRFVAFFKMPARGLLETNPTAYNAALAEAPRMERGLGSCAHCATPIANVYVISTGDGKRWGVGCDCIMKLAPADRRERKPQIVRAAEQAKRAADRARRHDREAEKLEAADSWIREHADELRAIAHPQAWRAQKGESMLDSLEWFWAHAGTAGKLKAFSRAQRAHAAAASRPVGLMTSAERAAFAVAS